LRGKPEQSAKPNSNRQPPTNKQVLALSFCFEMKKINEINRLRAANIIAIAPKPVKPNTKDNRPNMEKNMALYFKTPFSSMILLLKCFLQICKFHKATDILSDCNFFK
jgi:hypothetical protein